jgi:hypothetical protein
VQTQSLIEIDGSGHHARGTCHCCPHSAPCATKVARIAAESSQYVAEPAAADARTRYPHPGRRSAWCSRVAARSRRRTRLRTTAPPTGRPTANATRGGSSEGPSSAALTSSAPARRRRPRAKARNIARSPTRQIRPRGSRGPCCGAARPPRDRRGCASGSGIRASSSASGCSAGTSSSRMASSNARAEVRGPGASARWWKIEVRARADGSVYAGFRDVSNRTRLPDASLVGIPRPR